MDRREREEGAGPPLLLAPLLQPAAARVRFELPNLLAGSERDYCQPHAELVCQANGTRVLRRTGPRQQTLPGLDGAGFGAAAAGRSRPTGRG
jgi:hypothetical protein